MIFALLAPMLILAAGGAVDVTTASMRQAALQQAVDAATVAAVARTSPGYEAANLLTNGGAVPDLLTSTSFAGVLNANWTQSGDTSPPSYVGTSCGGSTIVCRQGTNVYASATAKAVYTPQFLGMAVLSPGLQGLKSIQLAAVSQSTASTPTYINYYIMVDTSQSMGIASTAADMTNLYNRVVSNNNGADNEVGCVFGCHVPESDAYSATTHSFVQNSVQTYSNEDLAHNISKNFGPPITLRIDSAVAAIQSIITQAQQAAGNFANIKIGLYEISHDPNTGAYYRVVSTPSSDYATLSTLAGTIDLGGNNKNGYGDTDFDDELSSMQSLVPANGTGSTASNPQNYVFIVTDGLSDNSGGSVNNHPTAAFNPADCSGLKANATVGVIYTTYIPIYNQNNPSAGLEGNYASLAAPYVNTIPTNLTACTSGSQYYLEASDGPAIIAKMQQLFAATQKVAHVSH